MGEMRAVKGLQGAKVLEHSPNPANHVLADICDSLSILDMESVDGRA